MKPTLALATLALASLSAALVLADQGAAEIPLAAFGYDIELVPHGTRPVHGALLPLAVYRGVRSADLPDLRVFNAEGQQVSHAIRTLDGAKEVSAGEAELPFFPLYAPRTSKLPIDGLALHVERDAKGTIIDLRPEAELTPTGDAGGVAPRVPRAYILDCSKLERPMVALRVELGKTDADYVLPLFVDSSEDLASFEPEVMGKPLVSLRYAGQRIEQHRIELPHVRSRYLRLRWAERELPAPLAALHAELGNERQAAPREHLRVFGKRRKGAEQRYDFDLAGFVPADRVRVVLPDDNMLIEGELRSSATRADSGSVAAQGVFYRVVLEGVRLESPAIEIERRVHRYWQLRVDGKGGGIGGGVPALEVEYYPDELLFVGRGLPPFQLAYGHHSATATSFSADQILSFLPIAQRADLLQPDTACGSPRELAGQAALKPPPPPPPLERYLLWSILILGTLVLGASAIRLARSVAKNDGQPPPS